MAPHAVVRLLRGNLDESKAQTFLKYGIILLAERRFQLARTQFRQAAQQGADVSEYMAKLDALGAPPGMAYVPGGEFASGPPGEEKSVELPPFYMDVQVVTNRRYFDFMRATGGAKPGHWLDRTIPQGMEDYPVTNITWEAARAYAEWANRRLPTVAEWEKAARGSDGRRYPWVGEFDPLRCNVVESGIREMTLAGRYPRGVSPYRCYDMIGNVLQWCEDAGPATGDGDAEARAVCGASFEEKGADVGCWRVQYRKRVRRSRKCGFRCAMDL